MSTNPTRILIIESSQEIFYRIEEKLKINGLSLMNVSNVDDALKLIENDNIDLILINYDSVQDIKHFLVYFRDVLKKIGKVLIVYCLSEDSSKKCREALKNGADDFIFLQDYYELYIMINPYLKENNGNDYWMVEKIKELVKTYKSNIRVAEISEEVGVDRYKLLEIFQKYENKSLRDYISDQRTEILENYIKEGSTFNQVCNKMGLSRKCLEKFIKKTFDKDVKSFWKEIKAKTIS